MSEMQEQKMLQQFNALGIFRCLLLLTVCYLSAKVMHESELLKNSFLSFSVPCESGNYWKCDVSSCVACPQGFYQPQWGQTSCWPCPFNTTTDFEGASSPTECKREHLQIVQHNADFLLFYPDFQAFSYYNMSGERYTQVSLQQKIFFFF